MRLVGVALVSFLSFGCAEEGMFAPVEAPCARTVAESPPEEVQPLADDHLEEHPPAPAVADSFDIHTARDEATRPRPRITRSISLGYIGDGPLSGGVMRDDYVPPPQAIGPSWQTYVRRGSWGAPSRVPPLSQGGMSFGTYPSYGWTVNPGAYGYVRR